MPSLQPLLIDGEWVQAHNPAQEFRAVNPSTGEFLPDSYPVSGSADVDAILSAASQAAPLLRAIDPEVIATFFEAYATSLEENRDALTAMAHAETGYPVEPRLNSVELPRTVNQLRLGAKAVRERSWNRPTIDTTTGIRSQLEPLPGAVLVFGPNNFPFAFNAVAGGDFVAALAAQCPVIAKVHASHPGTSRLMAELAHRAAVQTGLPSGSIQVVYRVDHSQTHRMIEDPAVAAVGFTGSRAAGLSIKETADRHGKPVYLEMSSVNPVFVLPGALAERADALSEEFFTSCTMGTGQFCTNPGLLVIPAGPDGAYFLDAVATRFGSGLPGVLLSRSGRDSLIGAIETLRGAGAQLLVGGSSPEGPGFRVHNTVLTVDSDTFRSNPEIFQTEAFGPACLVVVAEPADMPAIAAAMEGNLTGSIYSAADGSDEDLYGSLAPVLRCKVGRLLNDKMPTGVAVSPAMQHGGPFPATGHPHFTSVGLPASITRFTQLASYDNVRPHRLPPTLADANPLGIQRCVNGEWTASPIAS